MSEKNNNDSAIEGAVIVWIGFLLIITGYFIITDKFFWNFNLKKLVLSWAVTLGLSILVQLWQIAINTEKDKKQ